VRGALPELPDEKRDRFMTRLRLSAYDAGVLTASRELARLLRGRGRGLRRPGRKLAANWVMGELSGALNKDGLEIGRARSAAARAGSGCSRRIEDDTISGKIAKDVFEAMWAGRAMPTRSSRRAA
jgi:aspartyl-tRNA(Asn)/glutamyl-tRNA(Gln) amidotransferase subunit B